MIKKINPYKECQQTFSVIPVISCVCLKGPIFLKNLIIYEYDDKNLTCAYWQGVMDACAEC